MVKMEGTGRLRLTVVLPITATPDRTKEMLAPSIVMTGAPTIRLDPATTRAVGFPAKI